MTKFANVKLENGELKEPTSFNVDLNSLDSSDPLAFAFGVLQAKAGSKLPNKRSAEYKKLAPEYIRGFNSVKL
jgi:hypothetical protein